MPETVAAPGAELAPVVAGELARYFVHLAARVERAVGPLPPAKLWEKPFAFGNSIGHLVLHLTGNLNHYVGAMIAGTGYVRDRPREFSDESRPSAEEILAGFRRAIEMTVRTIESLDATALAAPIDGQDPIRTRFGLLLVCAAHLNNHIGQMCYLLQAHGQGPWEPPVWW